MLPHEGEDQMVMGVENLHGHFLIPGLKDPQREKGLREEHNLRQGK
jgi:hypothetical protein